MISKHISLKEATFSATAIRLGIDNTPTAEHLACMKLVAEKCFEPLREWYKKPIKINSFYRGKDLNKAVKGSLSSQHCKGEAIDMDGGSIEENKKLFEWCKSNLEFTQLINEYNYSWVHISYNPKNLKKQVLIIK
jgi:zinc D-Ala-D-Ala carboxypeptidase